MALLLYERIARRMRYNTLTAITGCQVCGDLEHGAKFMLHFHIEGDHPEVSRFRCLCGFIGTAIEVAIHIYTTYLVQELEADHDEQIEVESRIIRDIDIIIDCVQF